MIEKLILEDFEKRLHTANYNRLRDFFNYYNSDDIYYIQPILRHLRYFLIEFETFPSDFRVNESSYACEDSLTLEVFSPVHIDRPAHSLIVCRWQEDIFGNRNREYYRKIAIFIGSQYYHYEIEVPGAGKLSGKYGLLDEIKAILYPYYVHLMKNKNREELWGAIEKIKGS